MFDWQFFYQILFRCVLAILIGALIGSERARHGRAAGMRTHIVVCLGAVLTSLCSLFVANTLGNNGDLLRMSAQVISGIGFLGTGMIILKNNNTITGLTTAAGVWTTAIIGIALGFGFYVGALTVAALLLIATVLFAKLERRRKTADVLYVEIDDMYQTNALVEQLHTTLGFEFTHKISPPKSGYQGHLGINIVAERSNSVDLAALCELDHVVFVEEE